MAQMMLARAAGKHMARVMGYTVGGGESGTILAAMAATGPQPFTWMEPFPLDGNTFSERPGPVKGAPLLGTAKRPLDGEDRSGAIKKEEMLLPRVPKVAPQK
jgi:hypothetical protein